MKQLLLDVLAEPAPSLENYVAGLNAEAVAALRGLAAGRAVYLWGPEGCGRTHLLRAWAEGQPGAVYLDANAPIDVFQALAEDDASAADVARVAVDDLHRLDDARRAAVFTLYNRWREAGAGSRAIALAAAGDRAPAAMPLREDLRTRLGWDLVFRLGVLSDADKEAALQRQAAARGLQLPPEMVRWILTHYERDMRRLTALLAALDHYSLQTRRPVTLPTLRAMLAEHTNTPLPDTSHSCAP
ncbi:DnaA regulatory inactivator Hda [Pigmentiphaga soli]|uniref:DnaA regulatory inactivator Hda n=1 Tax=Pigmentiphaga soli TaxID=1007095 RepID=A0ABP8HJD3_9BURK